MTPVARIAFFDEPPALRADDDRRRDTLHDLLRSLPGFVAGYELREAGSGRLCSLTLWESEDALEAGERAVGVRPAADRRGIRPSRIERWVVDAAFCPRLRAARRSTGARLAEVRQTVSRQPPGNGVAPLGPSAA